MNGINQGFTLSPLLFEAQMSEQSSRKRTLPGAEPWLAHGDALKPYGISGEPYCTWGWNSEPGECWRGGFTSSTNKLEWVHPPLKHKHGWGGRKPSREIIFFLDISPL